MISTIHLNNQFFRDANEVRNKLSNYMLPFKWHP